MVFFIPGLSHYVYHSLLILVVVVWISALNYLMTTKTLNIYHQFAFNGSNRGIQMRYPYHRWIENICYNLRHQLQQVSLVLLIWQWLQVLSTRLEVIWIRLWQACPQLNVTVKVHSSKLLYLSGTSSLKSTKACTEFFTGTAKSHNS